SFLHPPSPTPLSPLSLHDALPISAESELTGRNAISTDPACVVTTAKVKRCVRGSMRAGATGRTATANVRRRASPNRRSCAGVKRSEEHTSELQSRFDLVCRLLLEK